MLTIGDRCCTAVSIHAYISHSFPYSAFHRLKMCWEKKKARWKKKPAKKPDQFSNKKFWLGLVIVLRLSKSFSHQIVCWLLFFPYANSFTFWKTAIQIAFFFYFGLKICFKNELHIQVIFAIFEQCFWLTNYFLLKEFLASDD